MTKRKASTSAAEPAPKRNRTGNTTTPAPAKAASTSKTKSTRATKKGKKSKKGKKGSNSAKGKKGKKGDDDGDGDDESSDETPRRPAPNDPNHQRQNITTGFPIKRILAQRQVNGKTEYLVDWLPTWTSRKTASGGKNEIMNEWDALKAANETIHTDTLHKLRIENSTNDDSSPQVRRMIDQILKEYTRFMSRPPAEIAADLFLDNEWQYLGTIQENNAKKIARNDDTSENNEPSATEILRHAFLERANNRASGSDSDDAGRYGKIKVQWLGNIDATAPPHDGQPPPPGQTVERWIAPLFAPQLWDNDYMTVRNWNIESTEWHAGSLRNCAEALVREAPYVLIWVWPIVFVSMFLTLEEIREILRETNFRFQIFPLPDTPEDEDGGNDVDNAVRNSNWEDRTRDDFIYTYMDQQVWEKRSMESVNVTFAACQVWLQSEVDSYREILAAGDYDEM